MAFITLITHLFHVSTLLIVLMDGLLWCFGLTTAFVCAGTGFWSVISCSTRSSWFWLCIVSPDSCILGSSICSVLGLIPHLLNFSLQRSWTIITMTLFHIRCVSIVFDSSWQLDCHLTSLSGHHYVWLWKEGCVHVAWTFSPHLHLISRHHNWWSGTELWFPFCSASWSLTPWSFTMSLTHGILVRIFLPNNNSARLFPDVLCGAALYAATYDKRISFQSLPSAWGFFNLFSRDWFWRSLLR